MLSRIPPPENTDIAVIDTEHDWIDPRAYPDDLTHEHLPLLMDDLHLPDVACAQQEEFPNLYQLAQDEESDYIILNGVLHSTYTPRLKAPEYPRLVLPSQFRTAIV